MSSPFLAPAALELPAAAVVLAHGPTGATLTSLNRLRGVLGPDARIIVTAAVEPGLTAVERASERDYEVVLDHGPQATIDAIGRLHGGPVLVTHDDVDFNAKDLGAMVDAYRSTGTTAVPSGKSSGLTRDVEQIDLVCAVGTCDALAALADQSGFGPGNVVTGAFIAVPGTFPHGASCRSRLADPPKAGNAPLLVAGVIVRDEAENIAACLASLDGIVDRVEVADTGSLDGTVAIARAHGAHVIEVPWRDDFADARNAVLDQCRDATFMVWIDADERLTCSDVRRFRRVLHTYQRLYPSYRVEIHNLADGAETHSFWAKRIVRTAGIHFEGAIHEQVRALNGEALLEVPSSLCSIDHHGYADAVMAQRAKLDRNLRIAQDSYERDPSAERAIHYARALEAASDDPVATLAVFEPLLTVARDAPRPVQAMLGALKAKLLLEAGSLEAAVEAASRAADLVPGDAVAGAVLAEAHVRLGRYQEALDTAADLRMRPSVAPAIDDRIAAATRARALFEAATHLGRLDEAIDLVAELPATVDPWALLAGDLSLEALVDLAGDAGARSDIRYLHSLVAREDLTRDQLDAAQQRYVDAGGVLVGDTLLDSARADLDRVEKAPDLRRRFEASTSVDDAFAYAGAVVAGHVDLALELEGAQQLDHAIALAFGIAAEALSRRGRDEDAVADAILAVGAWPGCLRAVNIVARSATASGMADVALDLIAGARATEAEVAAPSARRHDLVNRAVDAHLSIGDIPSAAREALIIVEQGGTLDSWGSLLQVASDDTDTMALVLGLALLGHGDDFLTAAAVHLRPEKTAEVCAAYLVSGGQNPDAVTMGLLSASLSGLHELAAVSAGFAQLLDTESRERLAAHLSETGAPTLAAQLDPAVRA